jgi:hypothetical protein
MVHVSWKGRVFVAVTTDGIHVDVLIKRLDKNLYGFVFRLHQEIYGDCRQRLVDVP